MNNEEFVPYDAIGPLQEVEKGLFLGIIQAAQDPFLLRKHNIKCVVNCVEEKTQTFPEISYLQLRMKDFTSVDLNLYLPKALKFIEDSKVQGKNVLVHCTAGVSRSPTIVIAYVMAKYKVPFEQAFEFVKKKRPCISPHPGFIVQLRSFTLEGLL